MRHMISAGYEMNLGEIELMMAPHAFQRNCS